MLIKTLVLSSVVVLGVSLSAQDEKCPVSKNIRGHENVEWSIAYAFHLTDENRCLPRALLVGDSICNGYQKRVRELTQGVCNVSYWISSYCVTSPEYLRLLDIHLSSERYDVVHINNGLHSLETDVQSWAKALKEVLQLIRTRQPDARVVWATSTPLKDSTRTAKVVGLNAAARSVIAEVGGIETDDLFSLLDPLDRESNWSDVYHHRESAQELEAKQVARFICPGKSLSARKKSDRPKPREALLNRLTEDVDVIGIVHWGLNTYTDREWGFGDEDPKMLNPSSFDAGQIVDACVAGGLKGLVVVAKHHDGFCLWPTKTTEHNIKKSPFRGGKGDYVKEMELACRKAGIRFGVYVSPWDRNNGKYGTKEYVDLYHNQLKELLNGDYGDVFEVWFDGANGGDGWYGGACESRRIKSGYYRFGEIFSFVRSFQPGVTIFAGECDESDFRWPGNERGELDENSRATIASVGGYSDGEYGNPDYAYQINTGTPSGQCFRMCEADFPLRRSWFYHQSEDGQSKHAAYLMKRYLGTVGHGGTMNLGIAPNRDGMLSAEDMRSLAGFKSIKDAFFSNEVTEFGKPFNVIVLSEDISHGEQVDHWYLWGDKNGSGRRDYLAEGRAIGRRRIKVFEKVVSPNEVVLDVRKSGGDYQPAKFRRYLVDVDLLRTVLESTTDSGETDTARWMTGVR